MFAGAEARMRGQPDASSEELRLLTSVLGGKETPARNPAFNGHRGRACFVRGEVEGGLERAAVTVKPGCVLTKADSLPRDPLEIPAEVGCDIAQQRPGIRRIKREPESLAASGDHTQRVAGAGPTLRRSVV